MLIRNKGRKYKKVKKKGRELESRRSGLLLLFLYEHGKNGMKVKGGEEEEGKIDSIEIGCGEGMRRVECALVDGNGIEV